MELGAFNTTDETVYRAVVMLMQCITLIVGLASLLFLSICLVSAFCVCFQEMTQHARQAVKPGPEPDTQDIPAGPDAVQEKKPYSLPHAALISTPLQPLN